MTARTFTITHTIELDGRLVEEDALIEWVKDVADDLSRCLASTRVRDILDAFDLGFMEEADEEPDVDIRTDWSEIVNAENAQ